ncbi:MAG: nucleotide exchange factor GrpE [Brevundimonas sp.]
MSDTPPHNDAELDQAELDAEAGLNADPNGDINGDLAPLDQVIAERDAWRDRALRAAAEAENVKRRTETQMNDARAYAIQRFAKDLLGVADNLERALQAAPKDAEGAAAGLVTGLEMTHKALLTAFEANGLGRVAPEPGAAFDPHQHQAMMEQPSDEVSAGQIIQTLQPGYVLFGRTVRPAMVVVAAKGSAPKADAGAQAQGNAAYAAAEARNQNG